MQVSEDPALTPKVKTIVRQAIDEFHPHVQTLLEAGYDLESSIEAVDRFGDVEVAMNYLDSRDEDSSEEGTFQPMTSEDMEGTEETWEKYVLTNYVVVDVVYTCMLICPPNLIIS